MLGFRSPKCLLLRCVAGMCGHWISVPMSLAGKGFGLSKC